MRYHIKKYSTWVNESKVDEGIMDVIKGASSKLMKLISRIPGLKWLGNMFTGQGSWMANMAIASKQGILDKGIKYFPSKEINQIAAEAMTVKGQETTKMETEVPSDEEVKESLIQFLYEAVQPLESSDGGVRNVDDEGLHAMIDRRVKARKRGLADQPMPLMIWGAFGIGKTSIVQQVAEKYNMDLEILNLSAVDPESVLLAAMDEETMKQRQVPYPQLPVYWDKAANKEEMKRTVNRPDADGNPRGGILFIDELTRGPESTNAVMMSFIQDRRIGEWVLGENWLVLGAANRQGDDITRYKASSAAMNRFTHVNYVATPESMEKNVDIDPVLAEFLKFRRELFHSYDPEVSKIVTPTPRTWKGANDEVALELKFLEEEGKLQNMTEEQIYNVIYDIYASAVSPAAAREFVAFKKMSDKISTKDIEMIFTNPEKAKLPAKETIRIEQRGKKVDAEGSEYKPDFMHAYIAAIFNYIKINGIKPEGFVNLCKFLVRLDNPNYVYQIVRSLLRDNPEINAKNPEFGDAYAEGLIDILIPKYKGLAED